MSRCVSFKVLKKWTISGENMKRRMLAVMVLVMFAIPAMAELTDYQKGAQAGIKAGFSMGRSYQQSYDGTLDTGRYNQAINQYDQTIQSIFAGNQTAINTLLINPTSYATTDVSPNMYPVTSSYNKPIHAIDASWNQTNQAIAAPPQGETIYGEPIDAYCTDNPDAPACDMTAYNGQINPDTGQPYGQPLGGA